MSRLTLAEFEEQISDRITAIALDRATNKITEKQAAREMTDLARWCVDRMKRLSQADQLRVMQSRLMEAIGPRD